MVEKAALLIHSAAHLCRIKAQGPQRGGRLGALDIVADGAVLVGADRILATGPTAELAARSEAVRTVDATGRCVVPGFADPHTHIPWAGDRVAEFAQRLAGTSYKAIMAAGGGINATIRQTREATVPELVAANKGRLARMLRQGTTSAIVCRFVRLTPAQALVAATLNAAYALGRGDEVGSLTPGKLGDLLLLDAGDYRELGYRLGSNLVAQVIKRGEILAGSPMRGHPAP